MDDELKLVHADRLVRAGDIAMEFGSATCLFSFDEIEAELVEFITLVGEEYALLGGNGEIDPILENDIRLAPLLDRLGALRDTTSVSDRAGNWDVDAAASIYSHMCEVHRRIRRSRQCYCQDQSASGLLLPAGYRERMAQLIHNERLPLAWVHIFEERQDWDQQS